MKKFKILPVLGTTAAVITCAQAAKQEPAIPIGKLHIDTDVVYATTKPVLTWEVTHPQTIEDVIEIEDIIDIGDGKKNDDTIVTKKELLMKVSMIGTGITDSSGKEYNSANEIRINGGSWQHIFTGPGAAVDVTEVLLEEVIEEGSTIEFRARYTGYDDWRYNTSSEVQIFFDGDEPPANAKANDGDTSAEEYMRPYTKDGKLVLGALDLIYAAELTHTKTSDKGYDMQDSIVLIRFTDLETGVGSSKGEVDENVNGGKSNNGHGNNADGVDSSNPGNAPFEDSDSSVDDEVKSNRDYVKLIEDTLHDYSDYDTSYGCGHASGGKPKDKSKKKDK
ncbi:hypothetical protein [Rubritalea marina]|uniref:hypothetical protein n=1 Tax=Rubritalea marina TaxID=361055 RepID=UPI000368865D|nr:hypothetical protein [Rubritalea marina]